MRGRRTAVAAAALAASLAAAPAAAATTTPDATGSGPSRVVERTISDPRISESSGLVASARTPGVLWTFNDSGGGPELFAVAPDGRTTAVHRIDGIEPQDWEAATALTGPDGEPLLAVGDIGDNAGERPRIEVHVLAEPRTDRDTHARPLRTLELTYPDQPVDAETLVADPGTGRLYVVSKGMLGGRVYAVPASAWPGDPAGPKQGSTVAAELELLGRVPLVMVTDGVALPDGRIALRTYTDLSLMPPPATLTDDDGAWTPLATTTLPRQGQGEGIGLAADGTFLLSTEGVNKPVLAFTAPAAFLAAGPTASASGSGDVTAPGGATSDPDGSGSSASGLLLAAVAAGLALLLVAAGALLLVRRS